MLYAVNERLCVVCARVADTPTPKLPGPAEMHTLPLADLGIKKGACRLAQKSASRARSTAEKR
jgi:hypothetical protein